MVEYACGRNVVLCPSILAELSGVRASGTPERDGLPQRHAVIRADAEVWFSTLAEFVEPAPSRTVKDDRSLGRKRRRFQAVVA
jgi:hypothetical protein